MLKKAIIIEDDADIVDLLSLHIADAGLSLDSARNGPAGLRKIAENSYDVLILDWNLPGLSGIEICRRIRAENNSLPIIMLTSRGDEIDKVSALEIGVDDYLVKPFSVRELNARLIALLRRTAVSAKGENNYIEPIAELLDYGELCIDCSTRQVRKRNKEIYLTAKEYDLLVFLAKRPGRPYTRDQLLEHVWEYESSGYAKVVTVYIGRLRDKLEDNPNEPTYLETVRGVGYRFKTLRNED